MSALRLVPVFRPARAFALILALTLAPAACASGLTVPTAAPSSTGGLTRDQAVAAAARAFPSDGVIGATSGRMDSFDPGLFDIPGDHLVWAVVLSGRFEGSCGPAPDPGSRPHPCPSPATRATVVVDFLTGQFILASFTGGS